MVDNMNKDTYKKESNRTATNEENSIWNKNLNGWFEEQIIHN